MAPIFDYKAIATSGKNAKGLVEAENLKAARGKLKKQNLMVTQITERNASQASANSNVPFFGGRVGYKEISLMIRQLASLVKANIPLVEALNAMVDQTEQATLKTVLAQVRQNVNEGSSLSKAMASHPKIFDNLFVNMVEAGESSGTLSLVLLKLADLKEAQMRLRGKVVSGMTYPALMMCVASVLIVAIFGFVIPKLAQVFVTMNKPMPTSTKILITISNILVSYWYVFFAVAFVVIFSFFRFIRSPQGRPKWDATKLKLPIVGNLVRLISVTRFASTMSTLLSSGVPIITCMNISKNMVGNIPIEKAIAEARENITEGQSIAEPLKRSGEFPPMVIHMIAIGEKTGELPDMLKNVSETYEEQVTSKIEAMTALLEPLMIIAMGLVVAFIVLTVFLPLMDISSISR